MVSNRSRYISESTSDDDDLADMEYTPINQQKKPSGRKPTRTPKCFSKNALTARENRLKKKVYISTLENQVTSMKHENKKLSAIVENQSFMIEELKKEVKYFKSVIANSGDIGKLLRAINSSAGMPVTSSLLGNTMTTSAMSDIDQWSCLGLDSTRNTKNSTTKHPWEENENTYAHYPTPESTNSFYSNPDFEDLNNDDLLLDLDIPIEMNSEELLGIINEKPLEAPIVPVDEHNYHSSIKLELDGTDKENDVGVCLHVSRNKVSLEFCPSCCDNAMQSGRLVRGGE